MKTIPTFLVQLGFFMFERKTWVLLLVRVFLRQLQCLEFVSNLRLILKYCVLPSFISKWRKLTAFGPFVYCPSEWFLECRHIRRHSVSSSRVVSLPAFSPLSSACLIHVSLIHLGFKMQFIHDLEELMMCFGLHIITLVYFKTKKSQADDLVYGEVLHSWN